MLTLMSAAVEVISFIMVNIEMAKKSTCKCDFCLLSSGGSVRPELGYDIENQNLGPISVLILELLKLFLPNLF